MREKRVDEVGVEDTHKRFSFSLRVPLFHSLGIISATL